MVSEHEFFSFIYERQRVWYNRHVLKKEQPWTSDLVLQKFKIINMYRELDRCTLYIIDKLRDLKDRARVFLNVVFFRFFNLDRIYEDLGIDLFHGLDDEEVKKLAERFRLLKRARPIFNNAYLISSGGKGEKHLNVLRTLAGLDVEDLINRIDSCGTPEDSLAALTSIPMVGPFLACEIWTDLTYLGFFKQGWNDDDFVNIGPGAAWGLRILYGSLERLEEMLKHLHKTQREVLPGIHIALGQDLKWEDIAYKGAYSNLPFLSITNVEGALCEFRKYTRLKQGLGKKRYFRAV